MYFKFLNNWYEFQATKDIILPYKYCPIFIQNKFNIKTALCEINPVVVTQNDNTSNNNNRWWVIASVVGHFNHGKTTILDYFANSKYITKEKHGITQVCKIIDIITIY